MFPEKKMSSCAMKGQESDEEVDLETLRLAALKSRKTKYGSRVNYNNLIPIVPVAFETSSFVETKIKKEKISPTPEGKITEGVKTDSLNKQNEDEKISQYSESTSENDEDVLSVDDKEEEDSLERLIDQLEAEISENTPLQTNRIVLSSKNSAKEKKEKRKKTRKVKKDADDEVELVQIKMGKEPGAIIEIRESASPENAPKDSVLKQSEPYLQEKSPNRRSRSHFRSRSRSPFSTSRTYRRSRSPYWYKSPRRSRSPFRRSRSPFWFSRRSRSSSRKSRSPIRRYKSPIRKRSYSRFSRSRSKSFERRRSPWSSPRRSKSPYYREGSPFYREGSPFFRHRNFNSPSGRGRRSFSPRDSSKSPKRRSRSPRRFLKNSPFRRSKSPFRRSKSPLRRNKSPLRRSTSPFSRRSKSPVGKMNSPPSKRLVGRRSKTPLRWSLSPEKRQNFPRRRSKSPVKKSEPSRKSPRPRITKDGRNHSFSTSPTPRRNRSPLRAVEKNKPDQNGKNEKPRSRNGKSRRSLSGENTKSYDRRSHRNRYFRRISPSRNRSADRRTRNSRSPQQNQNVDKPKEASNQSAKIAETGSQLSSAPPDPILEARKKKFENLNEVDPTVDKKISLKSVKESAENVEDDEDALTINLEGNLWEESEESGDECESRFKSGDSKKNRTVLPNRSVLSFRNLRESDTANRKVLLNKPLIEENRREKFDDRWQGRWKDRSETRESHTAGRRSKSEASDKNKSQKVSNERHGSQGSGSKKRSDRKPIVWSSSNESKKSEKNAKDKEVLKSQQCEVRGQDEKAKCSEKKPCETKERLEKVETTVQETDDFDKLISDFEKELESDICLSTKLVDSTVSPEKTEVKRPKIEMKISTEIPKSTVPEPTVKKTIGTRSVRISEATSNKSDIDLIEETRKCADGIEKVDSDDVRPEDGPEDYIEDDDFVLEVSTRRKKTKVDEEDNQSDLRAVLSRRRNERLTKVVNVQENMPTRLVQSAFQGLGNKKAKRQEKEIQESVELQLEKSLKNTGIERRRVLLLHRDKNPSLPSGRNALIVPEVNQEATIFQRFPRSSERRKRKLQRQAQDAAEELDQEEEEEGFEIEEEKQSRRFRLKRNITLTSQVQN